jgi:cytochrome P450
MVEGQKYDIYSQDFRKRTHEIFARMRQEDPIIKQPGLDGVTPIWFVSSYQAVEQMLLDDKTFVRDPALAFDAEQLAKWWGEPSPATSLVDNHMLNKDGVDHRRLRTLVSKAFTPRVIQELRPRIQQIADELVDRVDGAGQMELVAEYAFPLPITVIGELIGIPSRDRDDFRIWSDAFVRPAISPEEQQASLAKLGEFAAYIRNLVAAKRRDPGDELLSALIHVEEAGDRLNESELFSMLALLIVAGHETTVSLIGSATLTLLQHPDLMQELRTHPDRMAGALEELLRYDTPVERALNRFVAADTMLEGAAMKRGDLVIAILGSANRDEAKFTDAARLLPERKPNPHMAFGKGAHYCLGAPLARLEGEIALNTMLRRLPKLELAVPVESLAYRDVPLFRSLVSLPVRWS